MSKKMTDNSQHLIFDIKFRKMDEIYNTEWFLLMALFGHIMAVHDMLYHRLNWTEYDHIEFPGIVPRTFIGALSIASILLPFLTIFNLLKLEKFWTLIAVRFVLGLAVLASFCGFARSIGNRFGHRTGTFLRLITITQFHFLFYASRPLPNTFAIIFLLIVYKKWLEEDFIWAVVLATIATFIFRFELILFFCPMFLLVFASNRLLIGKLILTGFATFIISLVISVPFDSFMWGSWIWPEGEVIRFNILHNRSHEYGVSPFWWYFISALPRSLLLSLFLVPLGLLIHQRNQRSLALILLPAFIFVFLYSFLPHKELRFILYAVPIFNVAAAYFSAWIWENAKRSWLNRLVALSVAAHLLGNAIITTQFVYASARNYPGAEALMLLQHKHRYLRNKPISIHIDNYCAETGISRFVHLFGDWTYNKTENLPLNSFAQFDFLLFGAANKEKLVEDFAKANLPITHKEYFAVDAFHKISWRRLMDGPNWLAHKLYRPEIKFKTKVFVLKKI